MINVVICALAYLRALCCRFATQTHRFVRYQNRSFVEHARCFVRHNRKFSALCGKRLEAKGFVTLRKVKTIALCYGKQIRVYDPASPVGFVPSWKLTEHNLRKLVLEERNRPKSKPIDIQNTTTQAIDDLDLEEIGNFAATSLGYSGIDPTKTTVVVSSLVTFMTAIFAFVKNKSKTTGLLFVSSMVNFFSTIFLIFGYECKLDEYGQHLRDMYDAGMFEKEEFSVLKRGDHVSQPFQSTPEKDAYLTALLMEKDHGKGAYVMLYRREYLEQFELPSILPPTTYLVKLKEYKALGYFEFPDWFLATYWNVTEDQVAAWKRMLKGTSEGTNYSELRQFDVQERSRRQLEEQQLNRFEEVENAAGPSREVLNGSVRTTTTQISKSIVEKLVLKIIIVFFYLCDVVVFKETFKLSKMMSLVAQASKFGDVPMEIKDLYNELMGEDTHSKQLERRKEYFVLMFNELLETPTHEFAKYPAKLANYKRTLRDYESWFLPLPKKDQETMVILNGLYAAANNKYTQYLSTEIQAMDRQEPFVVMLRGNPGVGKSEFAKWLRLETAKHMGLDPKTACVDVTPDDKYWPPLSHQELFLFDEAGTRRDYSEDLLFRNLKGICSPAFFNAAAADISHKINPFTGKVIFATANTSMDEMATRVTQYSDSVSWEACCRRMIACEVERNPAFSAFTDCRTATAADYDSENFTHLQLTRYEFRNGKFQLTSKTTPRRLLDEIYEMENKKKLDHARVLQQKESYSTRREGGKKHFSVVLHGRSGQGKSTLLEKCKYDLATSLGMDLFEFENFDQLKTKVFTKRTIFVFDDLIKPTISPEEEDALMNFYNYKAQDSSVFIFGTNVSPKISNLCLSSGIALNYSYPFKNEGIPRRIGFGGYSSSVALPTTNLEFVVADYNIYLINRLRNFGVSNIKPFFIARTLLALALAFFSYGIALLWVFVELWICMKPKSENINPDQFSPLVYEAYRKFLAVNMTLTVKYVQNFVDDRERNLMGYARDARTFMKGTQNEKLSRIFTTTDAYHESNAEWKIYIDTPAFVEMERSIDRYVLNFDGLNEERIIDSVTRYAAAFVQAGLTPSFALLVEGMGSYYYQDSTLYVVREETQRRARMFAVNGDLIIHLEDNQTVPVMSCIQYPSTVHEIFNLSYHNSVLLRKFLKSQDFLASPEVNTLRMQLAMSERKTKVSVVAKKVYERTAALVSSPVGKVLLTLISLWAMWRFAKSFFGKGAENTRKWTEDEILEMLETWELEDDMEEKEFLGITDKWTLRKIHTALADKLYEGSISQDCFDEAFEIIAQKRKVSRKASPKTRNYDSDDDKARKQARKKNRRGALKSKNYDSDCDKIQKQDVLTLSDMNKHDAYDPFIEQIYPKTRDNMCMVYCSSSDERILKTEPADRMCYGMFVFDNVFVTVGHIREKAMHVFIGKDGVEGFHRAELVKGYSKRDLSVWSVPTLQAFKDISSAFISEKLASEDSEFNGLFQRFAPGKKEQFMASTVYYYPGVETIGTDTISKYGVASYGTFGNVVTDGGDCGLPYYYMEKLPLLRNKIMGIHCRGNTPGSNTIGVFSSVFKEDVDEWRKLSKTRRQSEKLCLYCKGKFQELEDDFPKCKGHVNVWHPEHESTITTAMEEIQHFFRWKNDNKVWSFRKNSGRLFGTVEHSHTQFYPNDGLDIAKEGETYAVEFSEIKPDVDGHGTIFVTTIPCTSLDKTFQKMKIHGSTFRLKGKRWVHPKTKTPMYTIEMLVETGTLIEQTKTELNETTIPIPNGAPIHVDTEMAKVILKAIKNKECGKIGDIPYEKVENNETLFQIGIFNNSKSHLPGGKYFKTPFSKEIEEILPVEKVPVIFDPQQMTEEQRQSLQTDVNGEPSPLATQSMKWAHRNYNAPKFLEKVSKNFATKINTYYADMRLLTDEEVIGGLQPPDKFADCIQGMELNASIGPSLKELYFVQKKSDIFTVDETGRYHWLTNPAAEFVKKQWELYKTFQDAGKKYWTAFVELLKMEKLKLSKMHLARSFCAQDLLGIMLERRSLGMFCARAMKSDPTCGIGTDPQKDFNGIYIELGKHPNIWAGDYKNFDRTIPLAVFNQLKKLLCNANPKIAKQMASTFDSIFQRIQITGKHLNLVLGGMPSGCFGTAPINSLANDYVLYASFEFLCEELDIPCDYKLYKDNVVRKTYGDDVFISVSDECKFFNRSNVARALKHLFGMTMDSSSKDGADAQFDTYENASWISRFFRQMGGYPMMCGALKPISINANFHYATSLDYSHLGNLMEKAQFEAAFWDEAYYRKVQSAIRKAIEKCPRLLRHVNLRLRETIHREVFESCGVKAILSVSEADRDIKPTEGRIADGNTESVPVKAPTGNLSWAEEVEEIATSPKNLRFSEKFYLPKNYLRKLTKDTLNNTKMSYVSKVNELFQQGKCPKPSYKVEREEPLWKVTLFATAASFGNSKGEAKEGAAYEWLVQNDYISAFKTKTERQSMLLTDTVKQMFMTPQQKIPQAPMMQADMSVVTDSGLYTNTDAPSPARSYNSAAIALDNPCATGAPFSKHASVFNIYQMWKEKDSVINPSLSKGTEILRISLDPQTLPARIKDYVNFHDSIIPSIECVISIAGAKESIGWIKIGWVKDASKEKVYTLDDIQQVSCETSNLNGTQILKVQLDDVRKNGMYRSTKDDPEPYPGLVMLVSHPVTNVQRNDAVQYPVNVQVRLSPTCVLMEPFGTGGSPKPSAKFDLGSYFYGEKLDLLIGASSVTNYASEPKQHEDHGFSIKDLDFKGMISDGKNIVQCVYEKEAIIVQTEKSTPTATELANIQQVEGTFNPSDKFALPPTKMVFGIAKVPELEPSVDKFDVPKGSVYTIPKISFKAGTCTYNITTLVLQEEGMYMIADLDCTFAETKIGNAKIQCMFLGGSENDPVKAPFKTASKRGASVACLWKDKNHNNDYVGDDVDMQINDGELPTEFKPTDLSVPKTITFLQTGNSMTSTALPDGMRGLFFVRQGTSTTDEENNPFVPIYEPIVKNATKALKKVMDDMEAQMIKCNLELDGANAGEIAFTGDFFMVRTDLFKKVKASITNNVMLTSITPITEPKSIASFNATQFSSWISRNARRTHARSLVHATVKQMMPIGGQALVGIGQGMTEWYKSIQQQKMLQQMLDSQQHIADANNMALAQRQKDAFERNNMLRGYSSTSAQHGLMTPMSTGSPQTREQSAGMEAVSNAFNRTTGGLPVRMSASGQLNFVPGPILNPTTKPLDEEPNPAPVARGAEIPPITQLRADAPEFKPKSTLNPNASEFIPKSTLNPDAQEFVPKSPPTEINPDDVAHSTTEVHNASLVTNTSHPDVQALLQHFPNSVVN